LAILSVDHYRRAWKAIHINHSPEGSKSKQLGVRREGAEASVRAGYVSEAPD